MATTIFEMNAVTVEAFESTFHRILEKDITTMTAPHIVDPERLLCEALGEASPDLLRHLLQTTINALLSADADAVAGAEYGKPSDIRTTQRNGYRHRPLDTRTGTIDVAIPGIRSFGLGWVEPDRVVEAFDDLSPALADCQPGCTHLRRDGDCGLDPWVEEGRAGAAEPGSESSEAAQEG